MLETIREYALERLAESGAEPELGGRHAEHFLELAERLAREEEAGSRSIGEFLDRLAADDDNFRSALEWARDRSQAETLLRLVAALVGYWRIRGFVSERRTWVTFVLARGPSPSKAYRKLLQAAGMDEMEVGNLGRAKELAADLLRTADQADDTEHVMRAMALFGHVAGKTGDLDGARRHFLAVRDLAVEIGDRGSEGAATVNLGLWATRSGDFHGGLESSAAAAELFRELGEDSGVAVALVNCGWNGLGLGDAPRAAASFHEGLSVAGRMGATLLIANGAAGLAAARVAQHEDEWGAQLLGAVAALHHELGIGFYDEYEEQVHERAIAAAKAALGGEAFAAAWARGEAMTREEIVAFCTAPTDTNGG
jgi:hypothetical protein